MLSVKFYIITSVYITLGNQYFFKDIFLNYGSFFFFEGEDDA